MFDCQSHCIVEVKIAEKKPLIDGLVKIEKNDFKFFPVKAKSVSEFHFISRLFPKFAMESQN